MTRCPVMSGTVGVRRFLTGLGVLIGQRWQAFALSSAVYDPAVELGDTHIYSGTSGWVSTVVDKSVVDASAMIAAIVSAAAG